MWKNPFNLLFCTIIGILLSIYHSLWIDLVLTENLFLAKTYTCVCTLCGPTNFWRRYRGTNPGHPRDNREYLPLYYNDGPTSLILTMIQKKIILLLFVSKEAQITMAGKKNFKAPNLTGPLASSEEECSAHWSEFEPFRLLTPEAGIQRVKTFSHLSRQSLKLIIRKLISSSQLVCKINEKIHNWTSNWCKFEKRCYRRLCISWGKSSYKSWDLWSWSFNFDTVNFPKGPLSNAMLTAATWHIPEKKNINIFKNITTKKD